MTTEYIETRMIMIDELTPYPAAYWSRVLSMLIKERA